MATEILVNDGGAPARILPFTAGTAISGGNVVVMSSSGTADVAATEAGANVLGVALTDASDGANCSIITGRGVILNAYVSGTVASGGALQVGTTDGEFAAWDTTTAGAVVAIMLGEDTEGASSQLAKVMLI